MSGITTTTNNISSAEAHEIDSTHRIREGTRAAVDRYRDGHPARPSGSSSGTLAASPTSNTEAEPSDGRFAKAGLIGAASGSGGAAKAHLGDGGEGVELSNKYGILSPQLKNERKKVLKVSSTIIPSS